MRGVRLGIGKSRLQTVDANLKYDFAAVGDGVADDTAALTAAVAQVQAVNGTLGIPTGRYRYITPLTITSRMAIIGGGTHDLTVADGTVLVYDPPGAATDAFLIQAPTRFEDFTLWQNGTNATTNGWHIQGVATLSNWYHRWKNVDVQHFTQHGMFLEATVNGGVKNALFVGCKSISNAIGLYIKGLTGANDCDIIDFIGLKLLENTTNNLKMEGGVRSVVFHSAGLFSTVANPAVSALIGNAADVSPDNVIGAQFYGMHIEGQANQIGMQLAKVSGLSGHGRFNIGNPAGGVPYIKADTGSTYLFFDTNTGQLSGSNFPGIYIAANNKITSTLAETVARGTSALSNCNVLTSGVLALQRLDVPAGVTGATTLRYFSGSTALGTPTHWQFAVFDSSFKVIRVSTDQLATAWAANTELALVCDSIPTTGGSRAGTTTVTLTVSANIHDTLTTIVQVGDSITVTGASIAAYNGTFTVTAVTGTTIQYVCGSSATDSLAAPFPTVQLAASRRAFDLNQTIAGTTSYWTGILVVATTVPTLVAEPTLAAFAVAAPAQSGDSSTGLVRIPAQGAALAAGANQQGTAWCRVT